MMRADLQSLPMKIVKAELIAEAADLGRRFVVAGKDVDAPRARLQDPPTLLETPCPVHQVSGGKVVVGLDGDQPLQCFVVAMDVGKNEQLQRPIIALKLLE